jgi:hypothetical protein
MKKIIFLVIATVVFALFTVSCDDTPELNTQVDSYYTVNTTFFYPIGIQLNYHILLNADTIKRYNGYVSRKNTSATLKVIEKGKTEADLTQEITLKESTTLMRLIKLPGQPVAIYEADKYTQVKFNVVYALSEDPLLYTLSFNGMEFENNRDFYIRTDQLSGTFDIKKEGQTVYSKEISIAAAGASFNFLQISTTEYATLPIEDLPDPANQQSYVRFFFFPADVNGIQQLELTTYYLLADRVSVEKVQTLRLNPGEITAYHLYDFVSLASDGQRKRGVVYDLKDLETGEMLIDHAIGSQSNRIGRGTDFKFATAQIKNNGSLIDVPIYESWY